MKILVINLKRWKRSFSIISAISIILTCCIIAFVCAEAITTSPLYAAALISESEKSVVIIDAGHGGEDPGAVGVGGVYEKTLNMEIALTLGKILTERGFAVMYTRTEDKLLYTEEENVKGLRKISDLKNRCKIAADYPEAMFISIHKIGRAHV